MKKLTPSASILLAVCVVGLLGRPAAAQVQGRCSDAERAHDFDFWIGEWEVFSDGKLAGTNSIQPILADSVRRALQEEALARSSVGFGSSRSPDLRHSRGDQPAGSTPISLYQEPMATSK